VDIVDTVRHGTLLTALFYGYSSVGAFWFVLARQAGRQAG